MSKEISISSLHEMEEFAARLAALLKPGMILTLNGELGAGKTTLTKYMAKALGISRVVNSPTFTIMKSYPYPTQNPQSTLYHIDAYRLEGSEEDLGFEECFENGLTVVEWPQYLPDLEHQPRINIELSRGDEEEQRILNLEASNDELQKVVDLL